MRRFFRSAKGSVSIYLTLLILPIFIFNAVLIDFARVKAAEKQTELAVKAANRSMLAAYDSELQKYGLYGVKLSADAVENYNEVIKNNLNDEEDTDSFRFIDTRFEKENSVDVKSIYALGNQQVFKQQILDEMKYRAPIEVTLDLFDKFDKHKDQLKQEAKESKDIADSAKTIEGLIEKRTAALKEVIKAKQNLDDSTEKMRDKIAANNSKLVDTLGLHDISTKIDFGKGIASLNDIYLQYYINFSAITEASFESDLKDYNKNSNDMLREINTYPKASLLDDLNKKINQVSEINIELEAEIKKVSSDEEASKPYLNKEEINNLLKAEQELVLNYAELDKSKNAFIDSKPYEHEHQMNSNESKLGEIEQKIVAIQKDFIRTDEDSKKINATAEKIIKETDDNMENTRNNAAKEVSNKIDENNEMKDVSLEEKQKYINKGKKVNQDKPDSSEPVKKSKEEIDKIDNNFEALKGKVQDILKLNTDNPGSTESIEGPENHQTNAKGASSSFNLLDHVMNALENLRNEVYVNEYTISKFNYHTLGTKNTFEMSKPEEHSNIGNEEAEYILYGLNKSGYNYAAAYSEIYVLRLALRFIDGLYLFKGTFPIVQVTSAIIYAATMAWYDTDRITSGSEKVPLIPIKAMKDITFNYKDYLRLFLILHSKEENKLARIQALVELNTGTILSEHSYAIQGTTAASVRLWFLPSVMKMLSVTGALNGKVKGNRYYYSPKNMMSSY